MSFRIIPKTYAWAHPLVHRTGPPEKVVLHHAAATSASPDAIHRMHLNVGYSGIGYHFYVRKDGRIYQGRPTWAMGAHALNHNHWLGVCAEGNFVTERMSEAQLRSLQWLAGHLRAKYPGIAFIAHRDVPGNATVCPGLRYPLRAVKAGLPLTTGQTVSVPVPTVKPAWWAKLQEWLRRTRT